MAAAVNTKTTSVKEFWNDLPAFAKILTGIVAIVGAFMGIRALSSAITKVRRDSAFNNNVQTGTTATGNTVSVDLGAIAGRINDAFFDNDWFGASEDEEAAVAALLNCPQSMIKDLIQVYKALTSGRNLKEDFIKFCPDEWDSISYLFK